MNERLNANEMLLDLQRHTVSSRELTEAAIDRIERLDGPINAVVVRDFDRARQAAQTADEARARGRTLRLLGLPMTVKESHNVAGLKTTWGSPLFKDWVAPADAVGVGRLKAAGAIILGKTNIPTFLADYQSDNPLFGRTNNPLDLSRTPGGSSGGAAAALVSGMTPLEFGSDLGGSIRVPAAFCGVYGHKPSYGLVPMEGHQPPGSGIGAPMPLVVVGPLARCARDLGLALDVLAGPTRDDAIGYSLNLPAPRRRELRGFRAMIMTHLPLAGLEDAVGAALDRFADQLQAAGVQITDMPRAAPALSGVQETFGVLLQGVRASPDEALSPGAATAGAWRQALAEQVGLRRRWAALFEDVDVVISPCLGITPFPHMGGPGAEDRTVVINGRPTHMFDQMAWVACASVANLPATVIPIAKTRSGLPIAAQIIGPYLEDRTTLEFAHLVEQAFVAEV